MRRANNRRDGTVAVVVAVSMIAILSVVALSLDGGMMMDKRREIQSAADAAALAGADDLYVNFFTNNPSRTPALSGYDNPILGTTGTAHTAAYKAAKANGFENGVNGCTVTVNIPPLSGQFTGVPGHVEVLISYPQQRYFSVLFGSEAVPIGARAVARGKRSSFNNAILVLSPDGKGAFTDGGNGAVTISGSPLQVNSTDPEAMLANGGGSGGSITAEIGYNVGGSPGYATSGTGASFTGPIYTNSPQIADPYANLPPPDPSTLQIIRSNKLQYANSQELRIKPGIYQGGIALAAGANVFMEPGIYYMQGGGFSVTTNSTGRLTGTGVMIYNDPQSTSDKISIQGQGDVNLSAPTSGPYNGILFWQNRTSTVPMEIAGNGSSSMIGLFYAAGAELKITGNGSQAVGTDVLGSQYISYKLTIGGNGSFNVNWSPDTTPGTRDIWLVE